MTGDADETVTLPTSLTDPGLDRFWMAVRESLERNGADWRGRVRIPDVPPSARLTLDSLTGRALRSTIDLGLLDRGLVRLQVGSDLPAVLEALGYPVSAVRAQRRALRTESADARAAAREEVAGWPEEWSSEWIDGIIRAGLLAGLDRAHAIELLDSARKVLDVLAESREEPISRVELAARHLGSSHALDAGTRLERAVTRALVLASEPADGRELWERAGAHADLVSGPALTWNLTLTEDHPLASMITESTALGVPYLFTQLALRECPARVEPGAIVLAVENPRVLEHAAQTRSSSAVVCTNGNPSGAVRLLLGQLLGAGAAVRYHGDFDAPGLEICARMHALGLIPWRMSADDYRQALRDAEASGVTLPIDERPAPATPWDPDLAAAFDHKRRIVHEERLLVQILGD